MSIFGKASKVLTKATQPLAGEKWIGKVDDVAGSETLDDALGFDGNREFGRLKPLGRGSTHGRYEPNNIMEEMAMKDVMDDPTLGRIIMDGQPMTDDRWHGWQKMQYVVKSKYGGTATVHYFGLHENGILKAVDDFKFPIPKDAKK